MSTKAEQIIDMAPGTRFVTDNDIRDFPEEAGTDFWVERAEGGYLFGGARAARQGVEGLIFPEYMIPIVFSEKMPLTGADWEIVVL